MIIYDRYLSYKTKNTPVQREYFCILCLYKILCDILCKWLKMLISWRRHPDSNRGSLVNSLIIWYYCCKQKNGAGNGNRTRNLTLARLCFTTKLYLHNDCLIIIPKISKNVKQKITNQRSNFKV